MKRLYFLAVIAAVFAICEVKEILKECPLWSNQWETIHIPHETSPHKFYKCVYGKKVEFTCPKNEDPPFLLCYNTELQVCDWPWNVTECLGPSESTKATQPTKATEPTKTTEPTKATEPTKTTEPTKATAPTKTTEPTKATEPTKTTEPTKATEPTTGTEIPDPWNCAVTGKRPHPRNCRMYYDDLGDPVCCLQRLVFNPRLCVCDIPINVPDCHPTPADDAACSR